MINFSHRLETEKGVFENILKNHPAKTTLDAGCGSGFHTILLSQLDLNVTGIDNSDSMLKLAKKNSRKYKVSPSFVKGDFLSLNVNLQNIYDAVFCMGNSFVHLLTEDDQIQTLLNFRGCLKKHGYLCLQIVNYDKILKNIAEYFSNLFVNPLGLTLITKELDSSEDISSLSNSIILEINDDSRFDGKVQPEGYVLIVSK